MKYLTGEEIEVGDLITTDSGDDDDIVLLIVDNDIMVKKWNLSEFGLGAFVRSTRTGPLYLTISELSSDDTMFIGRSSLSNKDRLEWSWE